MKAHVRCSDLEVMRRGSKEVLEKCCVPNAISNETEEEVDKLERFAGDAQAIFIGYSE